MELLGLTVLFASYMIARRLREKTTARAEAPENAPSAATGFDETAQLKGELVALRSQVAALRVEVAGAKVDPKSEASDKPAQDDRTPQQINADDEQRRREYMAGVSQAVVDTLPTVSAEHTQDGHGSGSVVPYMSAPDGR